SFFLCLRNIMWIDTCETHCINLMFSHNTTSLSVCSVMNYFTFQHFEPKSAELDLRHPKCKESQIIVTNTKIISRATVQFELLLGRYCQVLLMIIVTESSLSYIHLPK